MRITSIGRYLPERVVTAEELAEHLRVDESWIIEKTGVAERRWVDGETPVEMAAAAAEDALASAAMQPEPAEVIAWR